MKKIFISYSRRDIDFARKLNFDLAAYGAEVWQDERELRIGDFLADKLRDSIHRADYLIAILSKHSLNSEWVQWEIDVATKYEIETGKKKLLPVLIDTIEVSGFLKDKLFANFTSDYDTGISALFAAIQSDAEINIMTSVLIDPGKVNKVASLLKKENFVNINPLIEIKLPISLEITGGYFSVMRGATGKVTMDKAYTFHPHSRLRLFRDLPQLQSGLTIVAFGPFIPLVLRDLDIKELLRDVMYIIGPMSHVKSVIANLLDLKLSNGLDIDLSAALEWWSNPTFTNHLHPVKIEPIFEWSAGGPYDIYRGKESAKQNLEGLAKEWDLNSRNTFYLVRDIKLLALTCWCDSDGAKHEGVSDLLLNFKRACIRAQPENWYEQILREKRNCERCGYSFRLENLMICSNCQTTYCHRCMCTNDRAKNGNITCICGGELTG